MQKLIEQRLKELRDKFESGQRSLANLEMEQANLRNTLLRISGAIQVLEELIATESKIGELQGQEDQSIEKHAGRKTEMEISAME